MHYNIMKVVSLPQSFLGKAFWVSWLWKCPLMAWNEDSYIIAGEIGPGKRGQNLTFQNVSISLPCFLNAAGRCEPSLTAQLHPARGNFQAERLIQADTKRISKVFYSYEPEYIEEDQKHLEEEEEAEAAVAAAAQRQIQPVGEDEEPRWLKLEWTGAADAALFGDRNWNWVPVLSPNFDNANSFSKKSLNLLRREQYTEHHSLALHLL